MGRVRAGVPVQPVVVLPECAGDSAARTCAGVCNDVRLVNYFQVKKRSRKAPLFVPGRVIKPDGTDSPCFITPSVVIVTVV